MVPSASIPAVRQNRSKLTETASQALSTAPIPVGGEAINVVLTFFMALLSFRGISTPSLPAQGEQRRSSYFNIPRGNSSQLLLLRLMLQDDENVFLDKRCGDTAICNLSDASARGVDWLG